MSDRIPARDKWAKSMTPSNRPFLADLGITIGRGQSFSAQQISAGDRATMAPPENPNHAQPDPRDNLNYVVPGRDTDKAIGATGSRAASTIGFDFGDSNHPEDVSRVAYTKMVPGPGTGDSPLFKYAVTGRTTTQTPGFSADPRPTGTGLQDQNEPLKTGSGYSPRLAFLKKPRSY